MDSKDKVKSIGAVVAVFLALVLLVCIFATIDSSALEVPRYVSNVYELQGKGALNTTDANTLVNYVIALDRLGYLDTRYFLILARPSGGTSTRLYVSSSTGSQPVIGTDHTISISNYSRVEFWGSQRYYDTIQASSISFPLENVLCYKIGNSIINNVSNGTYAVGSGSLNKGFSDYLLQFIDYAELIIDWNGEDYQSGYDDGFSVGQSAGYTTGYNTGYGQGKTDGYNEGYEGGYLDGFADGEAEGGGGASDEELVQEYQRGYEVGYREGTDYGYQQGYNRGVIEATPNKFDVERVITAIPESVKTIFDESLGFELFGINVAGTLMTILVVAIVAFVVRKLLDSR